MRVEIRSDDLKRLTRDLRREEDGRQILKDLRKSLRGILRPIADEVKGSYSGGEHLRPLLRKAVKTSVRTSGKQAGARVQVSGAKMPDKMRALPKYVEAYKPRWRHPVWGHDTVWVDQPAFGHFDAIVSGHENEAHRQVEGVLDDARKRLEK